MGAFYFTGVGDRSSRHLTLMPSWSIEFWFLIGGIIVASMLVMLYVLAHMIQEDERIYEHQKAVQKLRDTYNARLRELEATTPVDLDSIGPEGDYDIIEPRKAA